jgi:hypothetical protein
MKISLNKTVATLARSMLACFLLAPALKADPLIPQEHGDHREFISRAVAPEVPALKYQLLVDPIDRQNANAADLYMQALLFLPKNASEAIDHGQKLHDQGKPLKDDKTVCDFADGPGDSFDLIALAARQEQCDWHIPLREQGFKALLPQLGPLRQEAARLQLRALLQLERGQTTDLLDTLRGLYALGQNTGKKSLLVGGFVGAGITAVSNALVADWTEQPDAPNLYWALVNLPRPFISFRDAMQGEGLGVAATLPVLAKGRHGGIVAEDWQAYIDQLAATQSMMAPSTDNSAKTGMDALAVGMTSMPAAKKYYADTRHLSPEEAEKLNSRLLLATYFIEQYQIASDEMEKLLGLPFIEQIQRADKWKSRLDELGIDPSNIARIILPAISKASITFARVDRQIAALTAIHALRAYAAIHGGELPAKLEDVTETPIPPNPMTQKAFDYTLQDGTATISDQTSPGSTGKDGRGLVYTLKFEGL